MNKAKVLDAAHLACHGLSHAEHALSREMLGSLTDKWSLWTMSVVARADNPLRFSRILEQVEGVSQKSLTKALRQLERDGLVTRKMFAEVPPRVEYSVTPLGSEMLEHIEPFWIWIAGKVDRFQSARAVYDRRASRLR